LLVPEAQTKRKGKGTHHCNCPGAAKVEGGRGKHLLATWIWRRARAAIETPGTNGTVPAPDGSAW
jgi:hypothetical protein